MVSCSSWPAGHVCGARGGRVRSKLVYRRMCSRFPGVPGPRRRRDSSKVERRGLGNVITVPRRPWNVTATRHGGGDRGFRG